MIKPLVNIDGKQFKVLAGDNINKINPNSRGFVINVKDVGRYDTSRAYQTASVIIYRVGKTGKYRLKHSLVNLPGLVSDDKKINEMISLDVNVELQPELCEDVRKYGTEEFIAWALAKYLKARYLLNNVMNRHFGNPGMARKYANNTVVWYHAYKDPLLQDLQEVFTMAGGSIINKTHPIFDLAKEADIKEDAIKAIRTLSGLTATLETYHRHQLLNNWIDTAKYYYSMYLSELKSRNCPPKEMMGDVRKIKPHKKYENYDVLVKDMSEFLTLCQKKKKL